MVISFHRLLIHSGFEFVVLFLCSVTCWNPSLVVGSSNRFLIVVGPDKGSMMFTTIAIGDALAERGNHVTLLVDEIVVRSRGNTFNDKFHLEIFKSSITEAEIDKAEEHITEIAMTGAGFKAGLQYSHEIMDGVFYRHCRDLLEQNDVIDRIRKANFTLVLASLGHVCPFLFAKHIDVPFIGLMQGLDMPQAFAHAHHQPINSAYMPPAFSGFSDRMSFPQRLFAAATSVFCWPGPHTEPFAFPNFKQLKEQYNISNGKSLFVTMDDAELWFANSHFAFDFAHPVMPDTILVGGLTTKPAKPLEKNLEMFMQSSGDKGVIIFAMGSIAKGLPRSMADMLSKAFAQLDQKVIWKLNGEAPLNVPDNVMLSKWLPQNDVLGHPKTKLFVNHCGLNGAYEALYHAVPMVCIPMFGDHHDVAARVVSKHIGIEIVLTALTSEVLVNAIRTVQKDPSYRESIQHLSKIFHDEPDTAVDRGAYWMEYVARHGDVKHLRSAAHDLSFIQYHLLDVIAVLLGFVLVVMKLICWCCRVIICRCCCPSLGSRKVKSD